MHRQIRFFTMLLLVLVTGCAAGPSGQTFDSPVGSWNEKYEMPSGNTKSGKVTIIDRSKGVYGNSNRLEFYSIEDDRNWKGYWIRESGQYRCAEEKHGSPYWGETVFNFNESYNRYQGNWDSCGQGRQYQTEGYR